MNDNLYTPKRWNEVNEKNKRLMQQHLRRLKGNKRRPNTIDQYFYDVRMFLIWNLLYNGNMCVLDFKVRHFEEFKYYLVEERSCSNARTNRVMSAVRMMMKYAANDDDEYKHYEYNVADKVEGLCNEPVKDVAFLTEEQVVLLREHLREHEMYKHMFLLDLFYDSGGRISEVFQVKNVSTVDKGYIKVICKGGKAEYLLIHDRAKESLKLYLPTIEDSNHLWLSKYGEVIKGTGSLREWVGEMYDILKSLDPKTPYFTPHSFRHTVIENLGNGTHYLCKKIGRAFTIEEIALLAHHKNTDMTKSYMRPKDGEIILNLFGINLE